MSCKKVPPTVLPKVKRMIVVGDIHGDWSAYKSSLKAAGVTDHWNNWTGGKTHLVQVGDLIDRKGRGNSSDEKSEKKILDHILNLKMMAQQQGGDVHILLGNHEIMNVMGDFRYVSPLGMEDFGGKRKELFRPGGDLAVSLACNTNSVIKIGSWIFSHAGIKADMDNLEKINDKVRKYLLGKSSSIPESIMPIFWHRDYQPSNPHYCQMVQKALNKWNARNMAIGHTVQPNGITGDCNSKLWKVDVGSSNAFGDKCYIEVLEIIDDTTINVIKGTKPCKSRS
jgi:hypothetical protein